MTPGGRVQFGRAGDDEGKRVFRHRARRRFNAHWTVHAMLAADDTVVTRWTGSGTHTADLMGIAATNKKVAVDGIWMQRVAGDKIAESWNCWDMLGLLQQLGVASGPT